MSGPASTACSARWNIAEGDLTAIGPRPGRRVLEDAADTGACMTIPGVDIAVAIGIVAAMGSHPLPVAQEAG